MTWRGRFILVSVLVVAVAGPMVYLRICLRYLSSQAGRVGLEGAASAAVQQLNRDLVVHLEQPRRSGLFSLVIPAAQITRAAETDALVDLRGTVLKLQLWPQVLQGRVQASLQLSDRLSRAEGRVVVVLPLRALATGALGAGATLDVTVQRLPLPLLLQLSSPQRSSLPLGVNSDKVSGLISGSAQLVLKDGQVQQGGVKAQLSELAVSLPQIDSPLRFAAANAELAWQGGVWGLVQPVALVDTAKGFKFTFVKAVTGGKALTVNVSGPPLVMLLLTTLAQCQRPDSVAFRLEDGQWRC